MTIKEHLKHQMQKKHERAVLDAGKKCFHLNTEIFVRGNWVLKRLLRRAT